MEIVQKKITPAFKGLTIETQNNGSKHHTFYSPGEAGIELEVVKLHQTKTGEYTPILKDAKGNRIEFETNKDGRFIPVKISPDGKSGTPFTKNAQGQYEDKTTGTILSVKRHTRFPEYNFIKNQTGYENEKRTYAPNEGAKSFLKIWTPQDKKDDFLNITDPGLKLGYRFIDPKTKNIILDEVRRIDINRDGNDDYCLAWDPERPDLKKTRSIYHLMPDTVGPSLDKNGEPNPDRRNHFNVFGGKITNMISERNDLPKTKTYDANGQPVEKKARLIDYVWDMGFTRILSTPVFNNGPKNSNGYWTKNPYQVDPVRGDINKFKNLQVELFKKGMGFIADGAFVNESWEGLHIKDIMNHGKDSPFVDWFFVSDKDRPINAPLLPNHQNDKACESFGIKIINGKDKLAYLEGKNPIVTPNDDYNPNLPTKIQIFDRRFASLEHQQNSPEPITTYDNVDKYIKDHPNEVLSFEDAVQPVAFEVNPNNLKKALNGKSKINPLDFALSGKETWGKNFTLAHPRGAVSNIEPWDGQNDILKLRFFVSPTEESENFNRPEIIAKRKKAAAQVQDNVVQVGEFWTAETEKALSEHAAKQLSEKMSSAAGASKAEKFVNAVNELAKAGEIPEDAAKLINKEQIQNVLDDKYKMDKAPVPQSITDGLMSYPLEAIDFPDEVCSILAGPYMKKLAAKEEDIGKSRYEVFKSKKYNGMEHQAMDKVIANQITNLVKDEIIGKNKVLKEKIKFDQNGDLQGEQSKAIFKLIAGDVMKYVMVKAIADVDPKENSLKKGVLEYEKDEISKGSFENWKDRTGSHAEKAQSLRETITKGLSNVTSIDNKPSLDNFKEYLSERVKGIDGDSLKVAKLILNKTESGLEWRIDAARDVAKMGDVIREYEENGKKPRMANTFAENWDRAIGFWDKFINGVKKHNPKYFAIGESSNLPAVYYGDKDKGNYPTIGSVVQKFLEGSKFTTESNYTYLYGAITEMAKGKDNLNGFLKDKLTDGWDYYDHKFPGYLRSAPVDGVLYSHVFTDNHDMKLSLHELSIDYSEFKGNLKTPQDRLDRWGKDTKVGIKLNKVAEYNNGLSNILSIVDDAFKNEKWFQEKGDGKLGFLVEVMPDGWIDNDDRLSSEQKKQYAKERKKLESNTEANEIKRLYSPAIVTADALLVAYEKAAKELNIPQEDRKTVVQALDNLAMGKFKGKDYGQKMSLHWARRNVNNSWKETISEAKHLNKDAFKGIDEEKMQHLADKVYENFTAKGRELMKAVELYKVILPGAPTVFNSTAETGMESEGKNESLQNRPRAHFEWLNSPKHRKQFAVDFNNDIKKAIGLRKRKELSPLVDGQTLLLKPIKNKGNIAGLYRYNKERDVITILNTSRNEQGQTIKDEITCLDLSRKDDFGVPGKLETGTIYLNALDEGKKEKYIVETDGNLYKLNDSGKKHLDEITKILKTTNYTERLSETEKLEKATKKQYYEMFEKISIDQPALILYRKYPFGVQGEPEVEKKNDIIPQKPAGFLPAVRVHDYKKKLEPYTQMPAIKQQLTTLSRNFGKRRVEKSYDKFLGMTLQTLSNDNDKDRKQFTPFWVANKKLGSQNLTDLWLKEVKETNTNLTAEQKAAKINNLTPQQRKTVIGATVKHYVEKVMPKQLGRLTNRDIGELEEIDENLLSIKDEVQQHKVAGLKKLIQGDGYSKLESTKIGDKSIVDIWIDAVEGEGSAAGYTKRLKKMTIEEIVEKPENTDKIIDATIKLASKDNSAIKVAQEAYQDLIDNERELNESHKKLLKDYKKSKLFYAVVTEGLSGNFSKRKIEAQTIGITQNLVKHRNEVQKNARENIFNPVRSITNFGEIKNNPETMNRVNFVLGIINTKIDSAEKPEAERTKQKVEQLGKEVKENSPNAGKTWAGLVNEAQEYFETATLDRFTTQNIKLLYSYNNNMRGEKDNVIIDSMSDPKLDRIEQKEFISRYKNDNDFKIMLKNTGVKKNEAVDSLLALETINTTIFKARSKAFRDNIIPDTVRENDDLADKYISVLGKDPLKMTNDQKFLFLNKIAPEELKLAARDVYRNWHKNDLNKFMNEKFVEVDHEHNINAQGKNIRDELRKANTTLDKININVEGQLLTMQDMSRNIDKIGIIQEASYQQMYNMTQQLCEINKNTFSIKANTRALLYNAMENTRFPELKEEIGKLLPEEEQLEFSEFLKVVDQKIKKEQNQQRKQNLIKAAILIGVATIGFATGGAGAPVASGLLVSAASKLQGGSLLDEMILAGQNPGQHNSKQSEIIQTIGNTALYNLITPLTQIILPKAA